MIFICTGYNTPALMAIDPSGQYETGDVTTWANKLVLRNRLVEKGGKRAVELLVAPKGAIRYSLDGREPREGTPEHVAWQEEMEKVHKLAEVIVGKQRHGPIGKVILQFEGETTRFSNYVADDHLPHAYR